MFHPLLQTLSYSFPLYFVSELFRLGLQPFQQSETLKAVTAVADFERSKAAIDLENVFNVENFFVKLSLSTRKIMIAKAFPPNQKGLNQIKLVLNQIK